MKVFLGGTVNGSMWRNYIMPRLSIEYFDPVVENWTEENLEREIYERSNSSFVLYVLTPKMKGYYAVAEVTDDSFNRPDRTLFCYLEEDDGVRFSDEQLASMEKLSYRISQNGAACFSNLDEIINFLNSAGEIVEEETPTTKFFDAFLCYGRMNSRLLATKMYNELSADSTIWFDQNPVPLDVDHEEKVFESIRLSHNFIYIISPHAIRSEYCKKQLEYAIKCGKSIHAVLHKDPASDWHGIDAVVEGLSWIVCKDHVADFKYCIELLIEKINTNKSLKKTHTLISQKAYVWNSNKQNQENLLYGAERKKAVKWLKAHHEEKPSFISISALQRKYIEESQKLQVLVRFIFFLHKNLSFIFKYKWFDTMIAIIGFGNPIALSPQLISIIANKSGTGVSIPMWSLFVVLQLRIIFVGIKQKDVGLFSSMVIALLISVSVIVLASVY